MAKLFSLSFQQLRSILIKCVIYYVCYWLIAIYIQVSNFGYVFNMRASSLTGMKGLIVMYPCLFAYVFVGLCVYLIEMFRDIWTTHSELYRNNPDGYSPTYKKALFHEMAFGLVLSLLIWPVVLIISIKRSYFEE